MSIELYSAGVFGCTEQEFFQKLTDNHIDTFFDVRMRRAVRGSQYAFVNSQRLQTKLAELGIRYEHIKSLAPTQEIRDKQHAADAAQKVQKRQREELGETFVQAYKSEMLAAFDSTAFVKGLRPDAKRLVFFCVERAPAACHRSLITSKLAQDLQLPVTHL